MVRGIRATVTALCGLLLACNSDTTDVAEAAPRPVTTATIAAAPMPPPAPAKPPHDYVSAEIRSSLEGALVGAVGGELGPALTQVAKRVLVWWIDPRKDLRKGDTIELVYDESSGGEPVVHAVWFESEKMGRSYSAVRYQLEGAAYPRWYQPDGLEVEERLVGGPIENYEQITSLLRDGRGHRGVDFKTPIGTPIVAPFDGVVQRVNWSTRANGNCIDMRNKSGLRAYLLHLDSVTVKAGQRVRAGAPVATSGNTGRSTAPHLHYQLQRGKRLSVDPFRFHKTRQEQLPADQIDGMRARLNDLARHRPRSQ